VQGLGASNGSRDLKAGNLGDFKCRHVYLRGYTVKAGVVRVVVTSRPAKGASQS
jgi:hypothetical protein